MRCKQCGNKNRLPSHKFCSQRCYWKSLGGIKGENAPNYKKIVGKSQVHKWLDTHYGKTKVCEGVKCKGKSSVYDWALKTGFAYERNRDNFLRLCRSCHRKYDFTPSKKIQAMKNLWWVRGLKNPYAKQ